MHCHGSVYLPYKKLGGGDPIEGFEAMNKMPYTEARKLVSHPVVCLDCHGSADDAVARDPAGLHRGHPRRQGRPGHGQLRCQHDGHQARMPAFVCGQCHGEVLLQGTGEAPHLPGTRGSRPTRSSSSYQANGFKDWTHAESGAPTLKAQHPEFEMRNQGVHARSGVGSPDCHMPYQREGALKISDHHVQSPLLNINRACQTVHKWAQDELRQRVFGIRTAPSRCAISRWMRW